MMLSVWLFTVVCRRVGTEHHHPAEHLKTFDWSITNSPNADITKPHVHDEHNNNLLFTFVG